MEQERFNCPACMTSNTAKQGSGNPCMMRRKLAAPAAVLARAGESRSDHTAGSCRMNPNPADGGPTDVPKAAPHVEFTVGARVSRTGSVLKNGALCPPVSDITGSDWLLRALPATSHTAIGAETDQTSPI